MANIPFPICYSLFSDNWFLFQTERYIYIFIIAEIVSASVFSNKPACQRGIKHSSSRSFLLIGYLQGEFPVPKVERLTLGHEFSGEVVALGESVASDIKVGDKVAIDPNL